MIVRVSVLTLVLILASSQAFAGAGDGRIALDGEFFSAQTPSVFAQANDEWGTSAPISGLGSRPEGYKSPSRALLYSLLLPGLGEIYVGDSRNRAAIFLTSEVGIWASFFTFRQMGNWREDDYIEFATAYAGVDPEGKDDHFWDMVGFYENRDEYNKVSRVYTRENPFFPESPDWDWQWQSATQRARYRDIKNDSKTHFRNADWMLAVAGLNRAVSAFFAWRAAKGHNRRLVDEFGKIRFEAVPDVYSRSIEFRVNYTRSF